MPKVKASGKSVKQGSRELRFGKKLGALDKPTRDKAVRTLNTWLKSQQSLTELDFMKIWKALHQCMHVMLAGVLM
jgi:ribosomal RNA-processing protein 1